MDKIPTNQQMDGTSGSTNANDHSIPEQSEKVKGQAEQAVSDVCDSTAETANENHEKDKNYKSKKSGKTIFILLIFFGIAVGMGIFLRAYFRRSRTGLLSKHMVKEFSGIARKFSHKIVMLMEKAMQ